MEIIVSGYRKKDIKCFLDRTVCLTLPEGFRSPGKEMQVHLSLKVHRYLKLVLRSSSLHVHGFLVATGVLNRYRDLSGYKKRSDETQEATYFNINDLLPMRETQNALPKN